MERVLTTKNVTCIPKKLENLANKSLGVIAKKKVAAYARVSTDSEEQASSYEAQVDYYTNYIKQNKNWIYVDTYSDEGISGTSTKKRDGFNRMINDALDGKIDLILTKSISRFARNTVDSLNTIRKLKEKNIEVYFEKENIGTLDGKGELLLTIMSSISQEESRSISQNTTWGIRKQFADGIVRMATKNFLGYDKDKNGKLVVNKEQAKTVKLIYKLYLLGYSTYKISEELERRCIKSPGGKDKWLPNTVMSILKNEKFKGDALLQKHYTQDFLTKKQVKNNGEVEQFYVSDDHEAIIDKKTFDMVQLEIKNRDLRYSSDIIGSKLVCGKCGCNFGRKIWHSNDKYKKVIYRCNHKYANNERCDTGYVTESEIKELFVNEFNQINKNLHIKTGKMIIDTLCDTSKERAELEKAIKQKMVIVNKDNELMERSSANTNDCSEEHNKLVKEYEKVQKKIETFNEKIEVKEYKEKVINSYIEKLHTAPKKITEFDRLLFAMLVDKIIINKNKKQIKWKIDTK